MWRGGTKSESNKWNGVFVYLQHDLKTVATIIFTLSHSFYFSNVGKVDLKNKCVSQNARYYGPSHAISILTRFGIWSSPSETVLARSPRGQYPYPIVHNSHSRGMNILLSKVPEFVFWRRRARARISRKRPRAVSSRASSLLKCPIHSLCILGGVCWLILLLCLSAWLAARPAGLLLYLLSCSSFCSVICLAVADARLAAVWHLASSHSHQRRLHQTCLRLGTVPEFGMCICF